MQTSNFYKMQNSAVTLRVNLWLKRVINLLTYFTNPSQKPCAYIALSYCNISFLPARRYASADYRDRNVSVCLSVRPSVCPSVMRRYCVKTKKASGVISSPAGSPKTLVFWRQISSPNSKGFPRTGASNMGRSKKFSDFLGLSVYISKTVADTAKVTISH